METVDNLLEKITQLSLPLHRGKLLARGLARGMIWSDGQLPLGSPAFSVQLTPDLLDHGFRILDAALRLTRGSGTGPILLSQATFLLAHIANNGPVPLYPRAGPSRFIPLRGPVPLYPRSLQYRTRPAFPPISDPARFPPRGQTVPGPRGPLRKNLRRDPLLSTEPRYSRPESSLESRRILGNSPSSMSHDRSESYGAQVCPHHERSPNNSKGEYRSDAHCQTALRWSGFRVGLGRIHCLSSHKGQG